MRKMRVWCGGSLNIGRFAGLQVNFDTCLLKILERRISEVGKGKARDDHGNILEKYVINSTIWNL